MKKIDENINQLLAKIEQKTFHCLVNFVQHDMPESSSYTDALLSITLGLATRTICLLCEEHEKEKVITHFCNVLYKMVKEERLVWPHTLLDKPQIH